MLHQSVPATVAVEPVKSSKGLGRQIGDIRLGTRSTGLSSLIKAIS